MSADVNMGKRHRARELRKEEIEMVREPLRLISAIALLWICTLAGNAHSQAPPIPNCVIAQWVVHEPRGRQEVCEFCNMQIPPMILDFLDAEKASGVGGSISEWNLATVARIDSLLRVGFFGDPSRSKARREAGRYLKYHALTAMDFIGCLGAQDRVVWETNEEEITHFFRHYANPGIYPVTGLRRVLLGGGAFCMDFDIQNGFDGHSILGTRPIKLRSCTVSSEGEKRPAWDLEVPVAGAGKAHYLYCDRYSGRIRTIVLDEEDGSMLFHVLDEIEGFYVKKAGTHRCSAIVFWRSLSPQGQWPPEKPSIGAAAYFPGLKLRLPWVLPDVNMNDLR
ncbi:MAG: hypothetical protein KAY24_06260, partial [Candidatus Eisenbacteria sp.]|nr:hypothetical protein [Candidatus Eisenbacteria bacterium]